MRYIQLKSTEIRAIQVIPDRATWTDAELNAGGTGRREPLHFSYANLILQIMVSPIPGEPPLAGPMRRVCSRLVGMLDDGETDTPVRDGDVLELEEAAWLELKRRVVDKNMGPIMTHPVADRFVDEILNAPEIRPLTLAPNGLHEEPIPGDEVARA